MCRVYEQGRASNPEDKPPEDLGDEGEYFWLRGHAYMLSETFGTSSDEYRAYIPLAYVESEKNIP